MTNMTPILVNSRPHSAFLQVKRKGYRYLFFSVFVSFSDFSNYLWGKYGESMFFTNISRLVRRSPFFVSVLNIINISTKKKMRRIYTRSIVASMANTHSFRDFSPIEKIRETVSSYIFSFYFQRAIAVGGELSLPLPTSIPSFDFSVSPESSNVAFIKHDRLIISRLVVTATLFIGLFGFAPHAHSTAYYIDFSSTNATLDGLATTTPFTSLDAFTEAARSAGDIAFVRRNTASTTGVSDLNFTSDGTIANPIIISADNDNLWNEASTTAQTYTVAVATSTFTASATITGVTAGDWFYVTGDCTQTYNSTSLNQCEFFYEVQWVSGTQLGLYMPYKGNQTGAGNSMVNLGSNPRWGDGGNTQVNLDTDDFWLFKGLTFAGEDTTNGTFEIDSSVGTYFSDVIIDCSVVATCDALNENPLNLTDDYFSVFLKKVRITSTAQENIAISADTYGTIQMNDTMLIPGSGSVDVINNSGTLNLFANNSFFHSTTGGLSPLGSTLGNYQYCRNCILINDTTEIWGLISSRATTPQAIFIEDAGGVIGSNLRLDGGSTDASFPNIRSTSTLRTGGGPTATEVTPSNNTTSIWDFNKIKLFEYPIYADTTSRQYDVYFKVATSTAEWTADPTATEMWIQCEYWAHDTGATSTRKVLKSTGVLDFNGSADWQALSVTCQPTQSGILYLSGYYGKPLEAGQVNIFLQDNTPIITP